MMASIIGIVGILLMILVPLIIFIYNRNRKLKIYYKIVREKSSSLKPKEILGERPFNKYYYQRPEDELISKSLNNRENVLIIGHPLSGKSRAAYQALTNLNEPYDVTIPICIDINLETFLFPKHLKSRRPHIILIDDLHRFVEQQNFEHLFRIVIENNVVIVATCRSGMEHKKTKKKMLDKSMDLETIFGENIIELGEIPKDVAKKIADIVKINWDEVKFDGTVGSIFMRLVEMENRFIECTEIEKTILRAIKSLYISGIYEENQVFPLNWIKICAKEDELEGKDFEWTGWLENLKDKEFVTQERYSVRAEEVYLEYIVKPKVGMSNLDIFEEMIATFSEVPYALFKLGNRAYEIGAIKLQKQKAEYMKTTIKACKEALKFYTLERFPMDYAMTQNNLGNAYSSLAEVESKADNCNKAIKACKEALKVYTLEHFPMDYAMTQNNLGNAYSTLAEVESKAENCNKAIKACKEALKVRTPERFPMDYAMTQNNLGNTYRMLAEVESKADNCNKAIKACKEALKVRTLERFPMDYAMTQNNLGNAYSTLAEVESKAENCNKAIKACKEALKVYTLERFPMDYAMTQNNLGNTYGTLSEVESKVENCNKAIKAYEEALKVRTPERFPMDYAATQNNLGTAFRTLAEVESKAENCNKAIKACKEALGVYTYKRFPMDYAATQNNLGTAFRTLAEVESKAENCNKAIKACKEALGVFTKKEFPEVYELVMHNLGILLDFCRDK